jgi:hypothetical protein
MALYVPIVCMLLRNFDKLNLEEIDTYVFLTCRCSGNDNSRADADNMYVALVGATIF